MIWFGWILWHINHCKHILLMTVLNEPELFFWSQLNGFKYFFLTQIILFNITQLCKQMSNVE